MGADDLTQGGVYEVGGRVIATNTLSPVSVDSGGHGCTPGHTAGGYTAEVDVYMTVR